MSGFLIIRKPGELTVPEEFKNKRKEEPISEIERLFKLYKEGALTKEEFEALKKKVIEKN
ncbi:MAG: SHOCT domain-containing protein [Chitinophagaceae bacterium]|nr:SHOCT domain-containing protein [Chitinophagaceae bacterium]